MSYFTGGCLCIFASDNLRLSHGTHLRLSHGTHLRLSHGTHLRLSHGTHLRLSHGTHLRLSHGTHLRLSHGTHFRYRQERSERAPISSIFASTASLACTARCRFLPGDWRR